MTEFLKFIRTLLFIIVILWAFFFFVAGIQMAPNDDMSPRIKAGDVIVYYKLDTKMNVQDIVVIKKNGTEYVGRVIAKSGDTVEVTKDSLVKVNGNVLSESDIFSQTPQYEGFVEYPLTLAEDECFILCDKRQGGEDSRYFGPVKKNEIIGTVVFTCRGGST